MFAPGYGLLVLYSFDSNVMRCMPPFVICTFYPVTDVYSCSWGALLCGVPRLNKWTESHWWSYQTDRCLYNQLSCHLKRESCTTPWRKREGWSLESKYFVTECSGGSRGGARGARLPPLFLDQNSLPKLLFWEATPPPPTPYVRVWITGTPLISKSGSGTGMCFTLQPQNAFEASF